MPLTTEAPAVKSREFLIVTIAREGRSMFVSRADAADYSNFRDIVVAQIPGVTRDEIVLETKDLYVCEGKYVEILPKYWSNIHDAVDNIRVLLIEGNQDPTYIMRRWRKTEIPSFG
ncbi:hypothetical protein ARMSODRAFT_981518 [Armillaria solidipes]|uniref:Uncharacterized protein n=1 Tax=Armillaria solidipes TaxID=1076256 RepID=A0A2H3B2T0_9AGAR|nr:hypothetical protein ARMSODRAFT_981518 [Armillaria solidipes]